jgi:hypothetical protein
MARLPCKLIIKFSFCDFSDNYAVYGIKLACYVWYMLRLLLTEPTVTCTLVGFNQILTR